MNGLLITIKKDKLDLKHNRTENEALQHQYLG